MTSVVRNLSELEGVSLGIVNRDQPCTAYAIRQALRQSPSSHWRASAGAIYPLLSRLEEEDYIAVQADADDGRGRKLLAITPAGRRALKAWIKAVTDPDLIANVNDPVRSRVFFLSALSDREQALFAEQTLVALKRHLDEAQQHLNAMSDDPDIFEQLGAMLGVNSALSRIESMKAVLKRLGAR